MTASMGETSGLASENEGRGMSDETEALLWARAHGNGEALGETLVELQEDFRELGLK